MANEETYTSSVDTVWFTVPQVAEILEVAEKVIREAVEDKEIASWTVSVRKTGRDGEDTRKKYRIDRSEVERLLELNGNRPRLVERFHLALKKYWEITE